MKFSEWFKQNIYDKMLTPPGNNPVRNRADGFLLAFEMLEGPDFYCKNKDYLIIETGCMRADHGELCFADDGCSTWLFDKFVNHYQGNVVSIDINQENINYAKSLLSDKVSFICGDSVSNLPDKEFPDLIYLDSYDFDPNNPLPSQLHHLKELLSASHYGLIASPCILMIDDHILPDGTIGKGKLIEEYFDQIGIKPVYRGYQLIYKL